MKNLLTILILFSLVLSVSAVSGQDISIVRPTAEATSVPAGESDTGVIQRPGTVTTPTVNYESLAKVTGDGIISGKGSNTVTLWDRSIYERQPKSVVLPNAKEMYQSGIEVPKPDLARPITDPWNDLREGYACEAILNRPYYFQQMKFGEEFELDITFRNVGTQTWDFNVDVMKYTGDPLEKDPTRTAFDLWKTVDPKSKDINSHIVKPGESIRVKIPMRAPTEKYHDDNKYYGAYTLVRNWNLYGWDDLHSADWGKMDGNALFCPVYFYIYVPE